MMDLLKRYNNINRITIINILQLNNKGKSQLQQKEKIKLKI